jgi:hypothetical protein
VRGEGTILQLRVQKRPRLLDRHEELTQLSTETEKFGRKRPVPILETLDNRETNFVKT